MADHPMEHAKLHLQYSYIQIYYAYTQTGTKKNQLTEEKKCHNHIGAQVIIMCWPLTSTTYSSSVCFFTALTLLCCDIVQNILLFSPEKLWMIMGGKKSSLILDGSTEDRAADWFWSLRHGNDQDLHRLPRKRHPVVWVYVLRFVVTHLLLTLILTCPQSFHLSTAVCKSWRHHIPPQPSAQT